jgi:hypothetical protein
LTRRLLWLGGIWAASVVTVAAFAEFLREAMRLAGLR